MSLNVVFLTGLGAGFLVFLVKRDVSFPVRFGLSIVAFSAVSAILVFIMQMSAR